jgi:APA family basic amino acid/polyamine antiporter
MNATAATSRGELLRVLGIVFGLAAVVGGMVGQGILRAPGIIAAAVPDPSLIIVLWLVGGCFAVLAAIPYVEVATMFPCAGGPYVFARRGLGRTAGVTVGWSDWMTNLSAQAFLVVVLAEFLHRLGLLTAVPVNVLAPLALGACFVINWSGTRFCGASQVIGSALKGFGLLLIILILLVAQPGTGVTTVAVQSQPGAAIGFGAIVIALRAIYNTYAGWNNCTYFCEEMRSPERSIPRAMFGGIALVTGLYTLTNVAVLQVLPPAEMAGSTLAAGDALNAVIGRWADIAVTLFGLLSVAALANLQMMFCSRIALAMARDGVLPSALTQVAVSGTPRNGLIATAGIAMVLAASGTYEQLIAISVATGLLVDLVVTLSMIRLRRVEPELARPWRAPFYPWPVAAIALLEAALLAGMIWEDPIHSLIGTGIAVAMGILHALTHQRIGGRPAAA